MKKGKKEWSEKIKCEREKGKRMNGRKSVIMTTDESLESQAQRKRNRQKKQNVKSISVVHVKAKASEQDTSVHVAQKVSFGRS